MNPRLLLDTCTFVWLTAEPGRISKPAAAALNAATADIFLSDASVWEICLKWQAGKIHLPEPPRTWIEGQRQEWRLEPLVVTRQHMYRVTELPEHHRDPFDRLLVAQAIEEGLTLVTPDPEIARYPVARVW